MWKLLDPRSTAARTSGTFFMRSRASCEKLAHQRNVHAVKTVEVRDPHALVHFVNRGVHDAELYDLGASRRNETAIGGAAGRRELWHASGHFSNDSRDCVGELAGRRKERLPRNE